MTLVNILLHFCFKYNAKLLSIITKFKIKIYKFMFIFTNHFAHCFFLFVPILQLHCEDL